MSLHPEPPDSDTPGEGAFGADAVLAAADDRLVAELGFPRRLVEPPRWARDLLDLGGIVNALMPLMGDWMARWSSALSYDDTDAPLVHARWTDPAATPVEESPPRVRARAVSGGAHHSVRISERVQTHVIDRASPARGRPPATEGAPARVIPAPRSTQRPTVTATAVATEGQGRLPHPGSGPAPSGAAPSGAESLATAPAGAAPSGAAPSATAPSATAPSAAAPSAAASAPPADAPTAAHPSARADMPSVPAQMPSAMPFMASDMPHPPIAMPSGMPSESPSTDGIGPIPVVASAAPARPDAGPLTTPGSVAHPTAAASAMPVAAPPPAPRIAPDAPAPVATARPADAVGPPGRVHPPGASVDIDALLAAADGRSRVVSRGVRHGRPQPVTVQARRAPGPAAPRSSTAAPSGVDRSPRPPVVHARSTVSVAAGPVVAARRVTGRAPTPVVRGSSAPLPSSPTPSHGAGPVPSPPARSAAASHGVPAPAGPRRVPLAPPQSAEELARMLGEPAPSPAPAPAPAPPADPGPVTLAPAQIRTIAGVVQQRVIRHIERERARTRTRV